MKKKLFQYIIIFYYNICAYYNIINIAINITASSESIVLPDDLVNLVDIGIVQMNGLHWPVIAVTSPIGILLIRRPKIAEKITDSAGDKLDIGSCTMMDLPRAADKPMPQTDWRNSNRSVARLKLTCWKITDDVSFCIYIVPRTSFCNRIPRSMNWSILVCSQQRKN